MVINGISPCGHASGIWLELGIAPEETGREIRHLTMNLF
jgi:hypothetical protein